MSEETPPTSMSSEAAKNPDELSDEELSGVAGGLVADLPMPLPRTVNRVGTVQLNPVINIGMDPDPQI